MTATTANTVACSECGIPVVKPERPAGLTGKFAEIYDQLKPTCDTCSDHLQAVADKERDRRQDEENEQAQNVRIKQSGLPRRHHHGFEPLNLPADVHAAAQRWASLGGGLLLTGPVGVGKTTIAGAACYVRLHAKACHWVSAPLLFARLGSGFGSQQHDAAVDLMTSKTALVLDDIDKARPTDYGAEQIFLAVDQRVEHEMPLLVTTNLAAGEIASRFPDPYGAAIASRLVGYCDVIELTGEDRRLGGGA